MLQTVVVAIMLVVVVSVGVVDLSIEIEKLCYGNGGFHVCDMVGMGVSCRCGLRQVDVRVPSIRADDQLLRRRDDVIECLSVSVLRKNTRKE